MRWIFFLLLVGNLLLLLLILQSDEHENAGLPAIGELEVYPVADGNSLEEGRESVANTADAGASQATQEMSCLRVGPFETRERALALTAEVTRLGLASNITSESPKPVTDFQVLQTPDVTGVHLRQSRMANTRAGFLLVFSISGPMPSSAARRSTVTVSPRRLSCGPVRKRSSGSISMKARERNSRRSSSRV